MTVVPITVVDLVPLKRWSQDDREAFIDFIARNPLAGTSLGGGVRKVRWAARGAGKRGGYRVVYFYHDTHNPIFLLTVFRKSDKDNLTSGEKQDILRLAKALKNEMKT